MPHNQQRSIRWLATLALAAGFAGCTAPRAAETASGNALAFDVSFDRSVQPDAVDGRVILMVAPVGGEEEPRFIVKPGVDAIQIFGVNVLGMKPDETATVDEKTFGYPLKSASLIPPGEYVVQAVLHKYETFRLQSGHEVKLPMDRGEGQHWNKAPGNLYSTPRKIRIDPRVGGRVAVELDQVIGPIEPPADTKYIRHIRIKSERLSQFWGRDMYLGAHVLVPHGFDEHPEARYPLMIFHGHFPHDFGGFRPEPPDPELEPDFSERFGVKGTTAFSSGRPMTSTTSGSAPTFLDS